jgi:hypothetical protein
LFVLLLNHHFPQQAGEAHDDEGEDAGGGEGEQAGVVLPVALGFGGQAQGAEETCGQGGDGNEAAEVAAEEAGDEDQDAGEEDEGQVVFKVYPPRPCLM